MSAGQATSVIKPSTLAGLRPLSRRNIRARLISASADGSSWKKQELSFDLLLKIRTFEAFVFEAYRFVLKREPVRQEIDPHLQRLEAGASKRDLISSFTRSPEAQQLGIQNPVNWTERRIDELLRLSPSELVSSLYRSFLL